MVHNFPKQRSGPFSEVEMFKKKGLETSGTTYKLIRCHIQGYLSYKAMKT
jgi:hypothetical protein